ncbi:MAG TPA: polyprenyl synthetase family protein, partial [Deltaproteobacteria bacterium]|nr:polyprenyl synthetase family protein [Deltaproteobacteria bacterium]
MDLKTYLKEQIARVDAALDKYLPKEGERPESLHKSMRYSVFAGGKRVRPVLMLAACQAVGGDTEKA